MYAEYSLVGDTSTAFMACNSIMSQYPMISLTFYLCNFINITLCSPVIHNLDVLKAHSIARLSQHILTLVFMKIASPPDFQKIEQYKHTEMKSCFKFIQFNIRLKIINPLFTLSYQMN